MSEFERVVAEVNALARSEADGVPSPHLERWLVADYGFSERGASVFMGQALEYEIANVVDPNFTVVAKVRKALLPPR